MGYEVVPDLRTSEPTRAGRIYQHPQVGIKAEVLSLGKITRHEDDEEFGMVSVQVPTVWYRLWVDGGDYGVQELPDEDFRRQFGLSPSYDGSDVPG